MTAELACGVSAASIAIMAGAALRATTAPFVARAALPALAVLSAALIPWLDVSLADSPRAVRLADLGHCFTLRAFAADDDAGTVDLWLTGAGRIVRLPLDRDLKDVLRAARDALTKEPAVRICQDPPPKTGGSQDGTPAVADGGAHNPKLRLDRSLFRQPKGSEP
jgi:hypothetical protein